jgi:hypothetical protein
MAVAVELGRVVREASLPKFIRNLPGAYELVRVQVDRVDPLRGRPDGEAGHP